MRSENMYYCEHCGEIKGWVNYSSRGRCWGTYSERGGHEEDNSETDDMDYECVECGHNIDTDDAYMSHEDAVKLKVEQFGLDVLTDDDRKVWDELEGKDTIVMPKGRNL